VTDTQAKRTRHRTSPINAGQKQTRNPAPAHRWKGWNFNAL
jgi:hypothetical protein